MDGLKEKYWQTVSKTRLSGRIAQGVKKKTEKSWEGFDEDVIKEALRIHAEKYPNYKETYTIGIMRNLQRQKDAGKTVPQKRPNSFNEGMKNEYDIDEIEKQILANQ